MKRVTSASTSGRPYTIFLQVGDIFVLDYVPWGNAILKKDGKIECQHGELECTLNTVEACALHYYPAEYASINDTCISMCVFVCVCVRMFVCRAQFWPFLHCLDKSEDPTLDKAQQCFKQLSYNWTAVDTCLHSDLGYKSVIITSLSHS